MIKNYLLLSLILTGLDANAGLSSACDLKSSSVARNIILVGENHKSFSSIEAKKEIFNLARDRKLILATEVGENLGALPWAPYTFSHHYGSSMANRQIHGIESPVFFPLIISYSIQRNNLDQAPVQVLAGHLIYYIKYLPLFRGAYESLRNQELYSEVYGIMDTYLATLIEPILLPFDDMPEVAIEERQEMRFHAFLTDLHQKILDLAKLNFSQKLKGVKLPYFLAREDVSRASKKSDLFFLKERDQEFASRISDLLCEYKGNDQRFVVLVGDAHASGVQKLLKNLSRGTISFKYFKSYIPAQAEALLREINIKN